MARMGHTLGAGAIYRGYADYRNALPGHSIAEKVEDKLDAMVKKSVEKYPPRK